MADYDGATPAPASDFPSMGDSGGKKEHKKRGGKPQRPVDVGYNPAPLERVLSMRPSAGSFKRGGKVRKTGLARVHKGERVLTKGQYKRMKGRSGRSKRR